MGKSPRVQTASKPKAVDPTIAVTEAGLGVGHLPAGFPAPERVEKDDAPDPNALPVAEKETTPEPTTEPDEVNFGAQPKTMKPGNEYIVGNVRQRQYAPNQEQDDPETVAMMFPRPVNLIDSGIMHRFPAGVNQVPTPLVNHSYLKDNGVTIWRE